jgi:hypothetical protein
MYRCAHTRGAAAGSTPAGKLINAYIITAFFVLALVFPSAADAQQGQSGDFVYDTAEGKLVVPLPEGAWRKVLEHETDEVIDMGTWSADWKKGNVFLIRTRDAKADAVITVNANISDIMGRNLPPPDFCYAKQRSWKYHKQFRVLASDTYCWGVNTARVPVRAESEAEAWQLFMEKNAKSQWGIKEDTTATQVRFLRWVNGRFLRIDYYFLPDDAGKPMAWQGARDWAEGIVARVKAGFEGKSDGAK